MSLTRYTLSALALGLTWPVSSVLRASTPSPFLAPAGAATTTVAPDGSSYELRGIMATPEGKRYCIYDPVKKSSIWVGLNEKGNSFIINSADSDHDSVSLQSNDGRHLSLGLRQAKTMALGGMPMGMMPQQNMQGNLQQPIIAPTVLKPTPEDEQKRLQMIADEVRRRRLLREQQQNAPAPQQ